MDKVNFTQPSITPSKGHDSCEEFAGIQRAPQLKPIVKCKKIREPDCINFATADGDVGDIVRSEKRFYDDGIALKHFTTQEQHCQTPVLHTESVSSQRSVYKKKPGTANVKGQLYKIQLSILFLLQGLLKKLEGKIDGFFLAANMEDAGDFKDIVFKYKCRNKDGKGLPGKQGSKIIFVHSRHADDAESKTIAVDSLLSQYERKVTSNLDINMKKHFSSYRVIKQKFSEACRDQTIFDNVSEELSQDFVIYTNAFSDFNENQKYVEQIGVDEESIFHFDDRPESNYCYKLIYHEDITTKLMDILEYSSDYKKLAEDLAGSVFPQKDGKGIEIVNQGILKKYHIPLAEIVIEKKGVKSKSGIFRTSFIDNDDCLSNSDRDFRNEFFKEAKKFTNKSETELKEDLRIKNIKLSDKFGENSSLGDDLIMTSLPNDRVSKREISEFLAVLTFFVGQPDEGQLVEIIKNKMKLAFQIEEDEVNSIFSDVRVKVEKWWKKECYYLTENNRFFQDSLRISVSFDVKRPIKLFTGRKQELENLHSMMQVDLQEVGRLPQLVAVTGLGGIGKSELVRQYIRKYSQDYDNNVIWINAENYATFTESFRRLAQNTLKINTKNIDENEKDIKYVVEDVYYYFRKRKSLFIFDNAEKKRKDQGSDMENISVFLPSFTRNKKTFVLITSRSQEWENAKILSLDVLTTEEASEFIKTALNINHGSLEDEVQQLTAMLQRFPLALQQAVGYITEENKKLTDESKVFRITDYIKEFRSEELRTESLLDFHMSDNNQYSKTTFITWKITFEKIQTMDYGDEALRVLDIIAYFAPNDISTKLFLGRNTDKRILGSALQLLKQYSLISLEQEQANIHRLVQQVIRIELKRQGKEAHILTVAMSLIRRAMEQGSDISSKCASHGVSVWSYACEHEELVNDFSTLPNSIIRQLDTNVRYEEAYLFGVKAFTLLEKVLGADHIDTLTMMNSVAVVLNRWGKFDKAFKAYEDGLEKFTDILGADHNYTLTMRTNMAEVLNHQGKYDEALNVCHEVLERREQILGSSHPDTLTTRNVLAVVLTNQGKYEEASKIYEEVLAQREEVLGPDHDATLMTKHGMASVYSFLGKHAEALKSYQEVLQKRNFLLGPNHPSTLITKSNIAHEIYYKGDREEARLAY